MATALAARPASRDVGMFEPPAVVVRRVCRLVLLAVARPKSVACERERREIALLLNRDRLIESKLHQSGLTKRRGRSQLFEVRGASTVRASGGNCALAVPPLRRNNPDY